MIIEQKVHKLSMFTYETSILSSSPTKLSAVSGSTDDTMVTGHPCWHLG